MSVNLAASVYTGDEFDCIAISLTGRWPTCTNTGSMVRAAYIARPRDQYKLDCMF